MIALAGALRLARAKEGDGAFTVRPRWELESLPAVTEGST
jgi:tRNA A37 threonylcarbamoyltransferase TsaD